MTTANPFCNDRDEIEFPETLAAVDELRHRVIMHVARVSIEHAGLPMVLDLLDDLEQWRAEVIRRSEPPPAWSIPEGKPQ
jgi:hypothetical protein